MGKVIFKLTLPEKPNLYAPLMGYPQVVRVVALSGGYDLAESNKRLAQNAGMIQASVEPCARAYMFRKQMKSSQKRWAIPLIRLLKHRCADLLRNGQQSPVQRFFETCLASFQTSETTNFRQFTLNSDASSLVD